MRHAQCQSIGHAGTIKDSQRSLLWPHRIPLLYIQEGTLRALEALLEATGHLPPSKPSMMRELAGQGTHPDSVDPYRQADQVSKGLHSLLEPDAGKLMCHILCKGVLRWCR
jgi:hypothetical protein